jgi:hypothetical protein
MEFLKQFLHKSFVLAAGEIKIVKLLDLDLLPTITSVSEES